MKKQIFAKGMKLTPAIESQIEKHLDKLNEKLIHDRDTVKVVVTLKVEHEKHLCEVVVFLPKKTIVKTSMSEDMYESIKDAFSKAHREVRKHKEKNEDKRHDVVKNEIEDEELIVD